MLLYFCLNGSSFNTHLIVLSVGLEFTSQLLETKTKRKKLWHFIKSIYAEGS